MNQKTNIQSLQHIVHLLKTKELHTKYSGLIDIKTHASGQLVLLNYTEECQHQGVWDEVTRHCRGLIIDTQSWKIVALPFSKFFNLNEQAESTLEALPNEAFSVYEKLDGSLGISYRHGNKIALATRGAFNSSQAIQGTDFLNQQLNTAHIPEHLTCLFEIIISSQNCVSHYDFDGLILLSAFDHLTGHELDWPEVTQLADKLGCKTATVFPFGTLDETIASRAKLPATFEGYVIRFESGLRVKLKGDAYLALNKIASGLTNARILAALADGAIDSFRREIPEEFIDDVAASIENFGREAARIEAQVDAYFALSPSNGERRIYAHWVQENIPKAFHPSMFRKISRQEINWFRELQIINN